MTELIKEFGNLSLGAGALIAMVFVIIRQMDMMKSMQGAISENTHVTKALKESIEENTEQLKAGLKCPKHS